jgi:predicted dehydrogenase
MSITVKEADAMVAAQKKNPDVIAQIGFQRRASAYYQEEIERIRKGELGMLIGGYGAWNTAWGPIGLPSEGSRVWLGRTAKSGDWMLEQACHTWDVFNWVADDMPVAASGMGRRNLFKDLDPERDVTDFYMANLEYPNDLLFDFEHSWVQPRKDPKHVFSGIFERVMGKNGGIDMPTGRIFPRHADGEMIQLPGTEVNNTTQSAQAFTDALRNRTQPVSGVENGRMATLAGLLVRKAVYERRRVTMDEIL